MQRLCALKDMQNTSKCLVLFLPPGRKVLMHLLPDKRPDIILSGKKLRLLIPVFVGCHACPAIAMVISCWHASMEKS
jgi:hypothetical protein